MLSVKPWKPEFVLQMMLALLACLCVGTLVNAGLLSLLPRAGIVLRSSDQSLLSFIVSAVSFQGAAVVLVTVLLQVENLTWSEAFGFRIRLGQSVKTALLVTVVIVPAVMLLGAVSAAVLTKLGITPETQLPIKVLKEQTGVLQLVLHGFGALVMAPVAEELIFRGVIYPTLKNYGPPIFAVLGSSMLFAATHVNLMAFLPLTLLAVVLVWLYERTENLAAPILVHSLFNTINFFLLVAPPSWASKFLNS